MNCINSVEVTRYGVMESTLSLSTLIVLLLESSVYLVRGKTISMAVISEDTLVRAGTWLLVLNRAMVSGPIATHR